MGGIFPEDRSHLLLRIHWLFCTWLLSFGQRLQPAKDFSLLIFTVACVFTIYITHHLSIAQQKYDPSFYGYVLPNTALAAAGIFTFLKAVSSTRNIPGWMDAVDKYSFGIYLAHILILNYVHPRLPDEIWIKVPLATIATLLGSMLLIYLIRKIPYGKYVSG